MHSQKKIVLLGLSLQGLDQVTPCLSLYNIKIYSLNDDQLRKRVSIKIHDETISTPNDEIIEHLIAEEPDVLGLSCYLWNTDRLISIAERLSKLRPQIKIILGGPDAGPRAERLLMRHSFISGIAHGEGEEIFRLFLRRFVGLDNGGWNSTPGLVCKNDRGVKYNLRPAAIEADSIPTIINDEDFHRRHGNCLYIESSRGCKFRCAYCAFSSQIYGWRTRSLSTIFEAIDITAERGGKFLSFVDAGFNQDRERFRKVMEYTRQYPDLLFDSLEINIEEMEKVDIELLAEKLSGRVGIGLQTTNPEALKIISRRYRPEIFRERIKMLHECKVDFDLDLICGLPGDNYDGFKRTIDDGYSMMPNCVNIFILSVLPGTRFEQQADVLGLKYLPEPPYTIESSNTFSKAEMRKAKRLADTNDLISTFSLHSGALQLASRELKIRPTQFLESFLDGNWRGSIVTDKELKRWNDRRSVDEVIPTVQSFFEYEFRRAGCCEMPVAFRDLLTLQFGLGTINSTVLSDAETEKVIWPPPEDSQPLLSPAAKVLSLQTDALSLLHDRPSLSEVKANPHYLLIQRTKKTVRRMRVPPAIVHILRQADGTRSIDEILDPLLEKIPKAHQQYQKTRLLNTIADLTRRRILVWE